MTVKTKNRHQLVLIARCEEGAVVIVANSIFMHIFVIASAVIARSEATRQSGPVIARNEVTKQSSSNNMWQVAQELGPNDEVKATYLYSDLDQPVIMIREGNTYYYHYNHQNSVEAITDQTGTVVERYSYDAFGNVTIKNGNNQTLEESQIGNPYYFTGRRLDDETGLYYYRNRYYNPELGRFMSYDPLGYIDSLNLYAYTLSNPVNRVDPFGLLDPTAMLEQRMAVCGGARDCQVDMTPKTPEEAVFQNVVGAGLNTMVTTAIAVPMVSAYGPAVITGLQPVVTTGVGEIISYKIAAKTLLATTMTEIATYGVVNYVLMHPVEVNEFVNNFMVGYVVGYENVDYRMPSQSMYGVAGGIIGQMTGQTNRYIVEYVKQILSSNSDLKLDDHPKKGSTQ